MILLELLAPRRFGGDFRRLAAASWISSLGDGAALAAGPLLVASQTHSPFLVASAALLQRLPWLVLGLHAGVLADRMDRRLMVAVADLLRALVVAVLTVAVATGWVNVGVVLAAMLLFGIGEVFSTTALGTLPPMLIASGDLGPANARLQNAVVFGNQLIGPRSARRSSVSAAPFRSPPRRSAWWSAHCWCCGSPFAVPRSSRRACGPPAARSPTGSAGCSGIRRCGPWLS